jgi:hypothetical protein
VLPEYQGQWTGSYRITQCTPGPTEAYRSPWCSGQAFSTTGTVTFTMTRNGEFVTGQFSLNGIAFPATVSSIAADGSLQFTSSAVTMPFVRTVAEWTVNSARRGQFEGRADWVVSGSGGLVGWGVAEGTVTATLQ